MISQEYCGITLLNGMVCLHDTKFLLFIVKFLVAVGTPITKHLLHKSVLALLAHTTPTLCDWRENALRDTDGRREQVIACC